MPRFLRVGVTGGIASGKSHVVRRLAAAGFRTIDLDRLAHEVMEPGRPAFLEVVEAFGRSVVGADGRIDRGTLGRIVFGDEDARSRLEAIVHPRVREEESARAAAVGGPVVTEAALLVESGMHLRFDRLVVVHCTEEMQRRRLMERDGLDAAAAQRRLDAQMPVVEKRAYAHFEVETDGALSETEARADGLARDLQALAARERPPGTGLDRARAARGLALGPRLGPRGLDPGVFVEVVGRSRGLELPALAARLQPPASGPWYRAASGDTRGPRPWALAGPVAAYGGLRAPGDEEYLISAMASVGRLTHTDPPTIGEACLVALAASAAWSVEGAPAAELLRRMPGWAERARRFAGGDFADRVSPLLRGGESGEEEILTAMILGAGSSGKATAGEAAAIESLAVAAEA